MGIIIETDRLILREWLPEDADAAFGIWGNAEVMRFVGQPFETVAAAREALVNAAAAQKECGFCLWAVAERTNGKIIGCCGFHAYEGRAVLELAYHLIPSSWGFGYATEAAAACVKYGFEALDATKIVAFTQPENLASFRVLEKLGMQYQGLVRYHGAEERMYALSRTREA
jgi:RimJ/RimL family protein N-acetyltransferase